MHALPDVNTGFLSGKNGLLPVLASRAPLALCCAGWLFIIAPFIYAFAFCFPAGDDFDEASRAMFLFDLPGGLYEIGREWLTWSGRFTYHFLAVFLGKAAESPIAAGLVCGATLFLHGLAAYFLALACARPKRASLFFGAMALLMIPVCHQCLPVFYLLTDSLTIVLQGAAFLLFLAALCRLWQGQGQSRTWKFCLILGICAIGVYEHAALAVFIAACLASVLAWVEARQSRGIARGSMQSGQYLRFQACLHLLRWLIPVLAFSFLAPGNFRRQALRGIDEATRLRQLANVPQEWLAAVQSFCLSPWPWAAICLALFLRFLQAPGNPGGRGRAVWLRPCAILAAFFIFSFCIAILHAQSDMPLGSAPKLEASLCLYAAVALAFMVYDFGGGIRLNNLKYRKAFCFACVSSCLAIGALGANFQQTAINAANGQILLYGEAMKERDAYLRSLKRQAANAAPKFGLAGEFLRGGLRRDAPDPELPHAVVPAFQEAAFPLRVEERLKREPGDWPNHWAAWLYHLGSLRVQFPNAGKAIKVLMTSPGGDLHVPRALLDAGIELAWRVSLPACDNSGFYEDWLILKGGKLDVAVYILRPNAPSWKRLAPLFLQNLWLEALLGEKRAGAGLKERLAATELVFTPPRWRWNGFYAFPLGPARKGSMSSEVFLGFDAASLYRLAPYK